MIDSVIECLNVLLLLGFGKDAAVDLMSSYKTNPDSAGSKSISDRRPVLHLLLTVVQGQVTISCLRETFIAHLPVHLFTMHIKKPCQAVWVTLLAACTFAQGSIDSVQNDNQHVIGNGPQQVLGHGHYEPFFGFNGSTDTPIGSNRITASVPRLREAVLTLQKELELLSGSDNSRVEAVIMGEASNPTKDDSTSSEANGRDAVEWRNRFGEVPTSITHSELATAEQVMKYLRVNPCKCFGSAPCCPAVLEIWPEIGVPRAHRPPPCQQCNGIWIAGLHPPCCPLSV